MLVEEAASTLEGLGRTVLRVGGDADLPDLEALRLGLPPRVLAGTMGAADTLPRLHRVLADLLEGGESVVVVDDADLLDRRSRAVLGLLHARCGVVLLGAVCASRKPGRGGSWLADRCQPLVRVALGPVAVEDLHEVLADRFGPDLSPAVTARVHTDSGGLPGAAVAVLESSIAGGRLEQVDGLWVAAEPGARAEGTVFEVEVDGLPAEARQSAEALAVSGPVPRGTAERLLTTAALDELEDLGLVRTVRARGTDAVLVHPPGLADHLEASCPPSRRDRLAALVGTGTTPDRTSGLLAHVLLRRHRETLSTAFRAWQVDRCVASAAAVLRLALAGPCPRGVVSAVLDGTDLAAGGDTFAAVAVAWYGARWALAAGQPPDQVVHRFEQALPGHAPMHGAVSSLAVLLRSEVGGVDPEAGRLLLRRIAGDDDLSRTARVAYAAWSVLRGRHTDALDLLAPGYDRWPELLRGSAELVRGLALFGDGQFEEGLAHARGVLDRAAADDDSSAYAAGSVVAALCSGAALDMEAVRQHMFDLLGSGASSHGLLLPVDRTARVLLASAALYTEKPVVGAAAVGLIPRTPGGGALPFCSEAWASALRLYADGALDAAAQVLDVIAEDHRARGHVFAANTTEMNRIVLRYDPARAAAFAETAERIGGPLFPAYLTAKQAMHDEDPRRLVTVADRLRRLTAVGGAARAYADAASLFQLDGLPEEAALAWAEARALGGRVGAAPVLAPRLSAREVQIVELVARGLSNTAIAEELFLSRRTVESHLRNIKRKTGAVDRTAIEGLAVP
ncbi:helix-turn-helix transcriptional regulator [Cellulosimicrobium cellulans]|uniref:helix-turn-helix transcriptional regulator n=1 Tax=Cellulosimicrobium cellulans TaxID=1710 RepID=UPI001651ECF4|nr:helix-turn-helix transcriptional regulator [Cellulosimicrobium cellulans]